MKKNWKKVLVGTLCLVGFLLLLVKGNQFEKVSLISTEGQSYEKAVVTKITKDNLAEDGNRYGTQEVRVQVKSGAYAGEEFDAVNPSGSLFGMENCEVGSRVIVIVSSTDDNAVVTVYSKDRTMAIYLFVLFFCLVICIIGGKKGVKAIASLAFTGVCIVYLMFPLMYRGISPIGITIVVVILSTLLTLWLLGGVSKKTVSAVVGTVSGVVYNEMQGALASPDAQLQNALDELLALHRVHLRHTGKMLGCKGRDAGKLNMLFSSA